LSAASLNRSKNAHAFFQAIQAVDTFCGLGLPLFFPRSYHTGFAYVR
jgi:hypothetical protein